MVWHEVNLWIGYTKNSIIPRADKWFDALYGASLLLNVHALKDVGILDEGFFLYWEETEMCLRLRKHDWKLAAATNSHVLHKVNGSTSNNNRYAISTLPHLVSEFYIYTRRFPHYQ